LFKKLNKNMLLNFYINNYYLNITTTHIIMVQITASNTILFEFNILIIMHVIMIFMYNLVIYISFAIFFYAVYYEYL